LSVSSPSEIDYSDSGDYETGSNFSDAHVFSKGERVRHNNRTVRVRQVKATKQQIKLGTRSDKYEVPFTSQPTLKKARKRRRAPADPGAAGPSGTSNAGPSDPGAAGPSEPPKASKKWKAGDSVVITIDGKQYNGTIFDRKGEFSVYYRDGTGTLRYKNLSEDGVMESITKRKKGGTRKTQRRFW